MSASDPSPAAAPSLEGVDWGSVYTDASILAVRSRWVRPEDADDIVTEGMKRIIEGSATWDGVRPLADFVVAVGYNAMREERRKVRRRDDPKFKASYGSEVEAARRTPEDRMAESEEEQRMTWLFEGLVASFAADREAAAVLDCEGQGVHLPAEQAERAALPIDAVRNARKRIKRRAQEILDELDRTEKAGE